MGIIDELDDTSRPMIINPGACSKSRAPDAWPMSAAAFKSVSLAGDVRTSLNLGNLKCRGYLLVP